MVSAVPLYLARHKSDRDYSYLCFRKLFQSAVDISNTDSHVYPLILKNIAWTHLLFLSTFQFLLSQTTRARVGRPQTS